MSRKVIGSAALGYARDQQRRDRTQWQCATCFLRAILAHQFFAFFAASRPATRPNTLPMVMPMPAA